MTCPPKIRSREVVGRAGKVNSSSTPGTASRSNRRATAPTTLSAGVLPLISRARSRRARSEEHTSELQSLMRISYAVFCLKKKKTKKILTQRKQQNERIKRI